LNGTFVMDDEAPTPFVGVSPGPGRYRPSLEPATRVEGASGNGVWRMFVTNSRATTAGTWGNATLTLTVDCDADQDGVADATDNCQATANTDQANTDDDALGDACDLDVDGDNLANAADRCPRAAAATTSGCPAVGRTASLRYARATRKLKAVVRSDVPGCRSDAAVTLYRAKRGKDTKLVVGTTNSNGRWTRKAPKVAGRYYVKVATSLVRGEAECGRATSRKARMSLGRTTLRTALVDTDGDGLDDTRDGCPTVAASTSTGCPVASRKVALKWLAGKQRLQVQVSSPVGPCAQRARIALFRVRPNKDFKVFGGSTSFGGRLRVKVARGATYYATVPLSYSSGVAECGKAESRRVLAPRG